jgi:hypothetical protein
MSSREEMVARHNKKLAERLEAAGEEYGFGMDSEEEDEDTSSDDTSEDTDSDEEDAADGSASDDEEEAQDDKDGAEDDEEDESDEEPADDEDVEPASKSEKGPIPYDRFYSVNEERKALRAELDEFKRKQAMEAQFNEFMSKQQGQTQKSSEESADDSSMDWLSKYQDDGVTDDAQSGKLQALEKRLNEFVLERELGVLESRMDTAAAEYPELPIGLPLDGDYSLKHRAYNLVATSNGSISPEEAIHRVVEAYTETHGMSDDERFHRGSAKAKEKASVAQEESPPPQTRKKAPKRIKAGRSTAQSESPEARAKRLQKEYIPEGGSYPTVMGVADALRRRFRKK